MKYYISMTKFAQNVCLHQQAMQCKHIEPKPIFFLNLALSKSNKFFTELSKQNNYVNNTLKIFTYHAMEIYLILMS